MQHFDVAVIGAGAGLMISEAAIQYGRRCAVVEKGAFGGTCLNRGCIPSKMLVYPADLIREAERGGRVGVQFDKPQVDWEKIARRMRRQTDVSQELEKGLEQTEGLTLFKGEAAFEDEHTLLINNNDGTQERFTADTIVIATGSRTNLPDIQGLKEAECLTSESFFGSRFPEKPYDSLMIMGGGSTGCEFAHIFSAMGTRVTLVVPRERLLRGEDLEVAEFVRHTLERSGIQVVTFARAKSVEVRDGMKFVRFEQGPDASPLTLSAQEVFWAPGIKPNTDMLNLNAAGVRTDVKGFVVTNDRMQTSVPHIWALGDVNGRFQLRHKANYEAEVLIDNLYGHGHMRADYSSVPQAVFTNPQTARVGLTESEARQQGYPIEIAYNHYSDVVAGIAMGYSRNKDDNGFVKIISDETKRLLGVHIAGPQAAALIQPFVYLMNAGGKRQADHAGSYLPIEWSMVIHPSLSELPAWALGNFKPAD